MAESIQPKGLRGTKDFHWWSTLQGDGSERRAFLSSFRYLCFNRQRTNTKQMTYILLTAFVWGIVKVINGFFEFFDFDPEWFYHNRPRWQKFILSPTIYCNICMSSFWGSVCYWLLLQGRSIPGWIMHCVICAGAIFVINRIIDRLEI